METFLLANMGWLVLGALGALCVAIVCVMIVVTLDHRRLTRLERANKQLMGVLDAQIEFNREMVERS